jgi:putative phosphoesterase
MRIGLISDTHGLLRPEAVAALQGADHIVHGGDICGAEILEALSRIAPVTAVRGNNDVGPWAARIPENELVELGGIRLYVLHDLSQMKIDPVRENVQVVVTGHSHKPIVNERDGVLYVNPGSAGPRRFTLPIAVGELVVSGKSAQARIIELVPGGRA